MNRRSFILATAGHVDHGKSALVRALTGADPDRLPEEKLRGMTIELGFAHLRLPAGEEEFDVGVVDVPGHEDFVRNMVAGVGSIDAALLVVAADDGWMPQTEEHLQILTYLGVRNGVVALTKCDLTVDVAAAERAVRERLRETTLSEAPIVRTSVRAGSGLSDLRKALQEMFSLLPFPRDVDKPRLAVDRAFSLKGVGTIVTGTLSGGSLRRGDDVIVQPVGGQSRIRALQSHGRELETAAPGMRVALNLPDLVAAERGARRAAAVGRGDVITREGLGESVTTMDVLLERSFRTAAMHLRSGIAVHIHHGTASVAARVRLLDQNGLTPGGRALARLTLQSPLFALIGDRFVLRDWSERHTLAGGVVLDVHPPGRRLREAQHAMVQARSGPTAGVADFVVSQVLRDQFRPITSVLPQTVFSDTEIAEALAHACSGGILFSTGSIVASPQAWDGLLSRARQAIDSFHESHPERAGLPLADLERIVRRETTAAGVWESVISSLELQDFRRDGTVIRNNAHRPALPPRLEGAGKRLRADLAKFDLAPPARQQIVRDDIGTQALKFLVANGEAIELSPDLVMSSVAYQRAVAAVRNHIRQHGPSTVSQLKAALSSSRRIMVPLVERLDRDGITRRQGDLRVLAEPALQ